MPLKIHLLVDEWQTTMQLHTCWRKRLPLIGVSFRSLPFAEKVHYYHASNCLHMVCSIVGCPFPANAKKNESSNLSTWPRSQISCRDRAIIPTDLSSSVWQFDATDISTRVLMMGRSVHLRPGKKTYPACVEWGRIGTAFLQAWRLLHLFVWVQAERETLSVLPNTKEYFKYEP